MFAISSLDKLSKDLFPGHGAVSLVAKFACCWAEESRYAYLFYLHVGRLQMQRDVKAHNKFFQLLGIGICLYFVCAENRILNRLPLLMC